MTVTYSIVQDGKPVARGQDQHYEIKLAQPSVGPVPLSTYEGTYTAKIRVRDNVTKKRHTADVTFEVK